MQTCYNCGKEVDDNVLICPECGALVKRYTAPAQQQPENSAPEAPQSPMPQPVQPNPYTAQSNPYAAQPKPPRAIVYGGADGKLHLRGLIMAWIVICAIGALYNAFSFGCGLYLYWNQDLFMGLFTPYAGAESQLGQLAELMRVMIDAIGQFWWVYVLFLLFYLTKGLGYILFAAQKRQIALYLVFGASAATLILMLVIGNGFSALWYAADAIVTGLLFRKSWKVLRK